MTSQGTAQRKPALSISAIDTLSRCGEQYRRRYIERERIAPGVAAIVGKGVDASVTSNLGRKIETGALMADEEVIQVARDTFEGEWGSQEITLQPEERDMGLDAVRGAAIDKTVRLSGLHHRELAPVLSPAIVQRKWTIEMPGYPMDLTGVTDIEEKTGAIRDTKTSGKTPREEEAHFSDQLTLYALAKRVLDKTQGVIPVTLDYLVDIKTPKTVIRESSRSAEDFQPMLRRIETAQAAIEKGVFVPARQTDWWCNERWCGYASSCPYFRGRKQVTVGGE